MVIRTRNASVPNVGGGTVHIGNTLVSAYRPTNNYSRCIDTVGNPKGENPFDLTHRRLEYWTPINGSYSFFTAVNAVPTCIKDPWNSSHLPLTGYVRPASDAIADSHPGEPAVAVPVFLFELKDVPEMLRHAMGRARSLANAARGKTHADITKYLGNPKDPAKDWLNYNFGWRPFFSDIAKIGKVAEWMKNRSEVMKKLHRSDFISRRGKQGSRSAVSVNNQAAFDSSMDSWYGSEKKSTQSDQWVVSHWVADPFLFNASLSDDYQYLLRHALGIDFAASHLWDAMPWSWLVDWFAGAGSVVHALQNRMGIQFKNASAMNHTVTKVETIPRRHPTLRAGPAMAVYETKFRTPTSPSILPSGVNYFGAGQLTTLASLAVTRGYLR